MRGAWQALPGTFENQLICPIETPHALQPNSAIGATRQTNHLYCWPRPLPPSSHTPPTHISKKIGPNPITTHFNTPPLHTSHLTPSSHHRRRLMATMEQSPQSLITLPVRQLLFQAARHLDSSQPIATIPAITTVHDVVFAASVSLTDADDVTPVMLLSENTSRLVRKVRHRMEAHEKISKAILRLSSKSALSTKALSLTLPTSGCHRPLQSLAPAWRCFAR